MKRYFNTEGVCFPDEHYMVNLEERLNQIKVLVDQRKYFLINRGRQYGKTTTLYALAEFLRKEYVVAHLDFQMLSSSSFATEQAFSAAFADIFLKTLTQTKAIQFLDEEILKSLSANDPSLNLTILFRRLSELCSTAQRPLVLMIDEVDQASNNQVFLDFLAQLRGYYLDRRNTPTFQSVILAGVYDVKNLKLKLRPESEHKFNSPWNIAARFDVNMDFMPSDIETMLQEYEDDKKTGMDIVQIAQSIYDYTSGYPVLVSSICKVLDEELVGTEQFPTLADAWSEPGVSEAVRRIVSNPTMIFESMVKHIDQYPELKEMLKGILFQGDKPEYLLDDYATKLGTMFGYVCNRNGKLQVANRIFETRLYNLFLFEEKKKSADSKSTNDAAESAKPQFIANGKLNMELVLEKFVTYFSDIYEGNDESFIEKQGRKLFLLYLRPIINGEGNYYVEAETRNSRRTDVIVDYRGKRFVIELKIWRGEQYQIEGEKQLTDYLNQYHLETGYLLTFSFIKGKTVGVKTVERAGKTIVEAVV